MAIEFTNKPIKWTNEGTAPSEDLKTNGFQAGYKPPAAVFNKQWHATGECIEELQTEVSSIDDKKANSSDVLKKTNTAAFTPTADYHPATKKYVDDNKIDIIDDLNTMSNVAALSANQGRILGNEIAALPIRNVQGKMIGFTTTDNGITTTHYDKAEEGATVVGDTYVGDMAPGHQYEYPRSGVGHSVAVGKYSTALGEGSAARGQQSLAAGYICKANGLRSVALGDRVTAGGQASFAIGYSTNATESAAVAMGHNATASGFASFAMGSDNTASGSHAFVAGVGNNGLDYQTKIGAYAKDGTKGAGGGTAGDAFIIGNGTFSTFSNAFRVAYNGSVYGLASYSSSGADYAEYFEWKDGNPDNEDRRGRLVTLDGEKIRFATADDEYILGVVSANPCVKGDVYSDDWQGKYLTDVFGQRLTQTVHIPARYEEQEITDPETGETTTENVLIEDEHDAVQWVLNPDYDPEQEYISREDRKEWTSIGLMGKLVVIDDGTCEVNGYCKAGVNGIATKADDGYRVMARIDDTHIRVLVR